ncbi:MAG: hypothetical protein ACON4A_01080 [Flavobacteriaceae bacterium]
MRVFLWCGRVISARFGKLTDLAAEFTEAGSTTPWTLSSSKCHLDTLDEPAGSTTEYPTNHTQKPTTYTHKTTANNAGGGAYIYYGLAVPLG